MKTESPDLFRVSPSSDLHILLDKQMHQVLPDRDDNNCIVFIFRLSELYAHISYLNDLNETSKIIYIFSTENCHPHECEVEKVFRSNILVLENAIRDPKNQIGGLVILLDMAGVRFGHAKFLSPQLAKRTVDVIQDAFPIRFRAFHILHQPFYFDAILSFLRPFMKDKVRKRVSFTLMLIA